MTDKLRVASWGMLMGPLAFFYFYFIDWSIRIGAVPPTSFIESAILASMLLRLAVVMSVKRLRRAKVWLIIDIFALEVLVTAGLLLVYIYTRDPAYFSLVNSIALAWPAALLLVAPAYALYRFAAALVGRANLATVIPSAIGLFVLLLFPAEVASLSRYVESLSAISRLLLQVILGQLRPDALTPEITFSSFIMYLALTVYVVTTAEVGQGGGRVAALSIAVAGSIAALAWTYFLLPFTLDLFLLFAVPGLTILSIIWWTTRGR